MKLCCQASPFKIRIDSAFSSQPAPKLHWVESAPPHVLQDLVSSLVAITLAFTVTFSDALAVGQSGIQIRARFRPFRSLPELDERRARIRVFLGAKIDSEDSSPGASRHLFEIPVGTYRSSHYVEFSREALAERRLRRISLNITPARSRSSRIAPSENPALSASRRCRLIRPNGGAGCRVVDRGGATRPGSSAGAWRASLAAAPGTARTIQTLAAY